MDQTSPPIFYGGGIASLGSHAVADATHREHNGPPIEHRAAPAVHTAAAMASRSPLLVYCATVTILNVSDLIMRRFCVAGLSMAAVRPDGDRIGTTGSNATHPQNPSKVTSSVDGQSG